MAETTSSSATANAGIDLSQFYQVFFEEAGENLDKIEQLLLSLDITIADNEELNAVFRCAHSIKGGAATFGFADVAELTHEMETLLDRLRRRGLAPSAAMVDVLLACGDALRGQLAHHRGADCALLDTSELLAGIRALMAGHAASAHPAAAVVSRTRAPVTVARHQQRVIELRVGPLDRPEDADNLIDLSPRDRRARRDRAARQRNCGRGHAAIQGHDELLRQRPARPVHLSRVARAGDVDTTRRRAGRQDERLRGRPCDRAPSDCGYGFYADAPGAPPMAAPEAASAVAASGQVTLAKPTPKIDPPGVADSSTLRVSVEKVDQLINLMGELVITQAMLAQTGRGLDHTLHRSRPASRQPRA